MKTYDIFILSVERPRFIERAAEISKRIDIATIGAGLVVIIFNPALGGVMIFGSAITYFAADALQRKQR